MKNLFLIDRSQTILLLSETYNGSVHDKRIADDYPFALPAYSWLLQDLGFLAFTLDGVETVTPIKKPKGGALTQAQKDFNRQLAAVHIHIEHVISSVKRCRIVKELCRLRVLGAMDALIEIASSLHNFRLAIHPWSLFL